MKILLQFAFLLLQWCGVAIKYGCSGNKNLFSYSLTLVFPGSLCTKAVSAGNGNNAQCQGFAGFSAQMRGFQLRTKTIHSYNFQFSCSLISIVFHNNILGVFEIFLNIFVKIVTITLTNFFQFLTFNQVFNIRNSF